MREDAWDERSTGKQDQVSRMQRKPGIEGSKCSEGDAGGEERGKG